MAVDIFEKHWEFAADSGAVFNFSLSGGGASGVLPDFVNFFATVETIVPGAAISIDVNPGNSWIADSGFGSAGGLRFMQENGLGTYTGYIGSGGFNTATLAGWYAKELFIVVACASGFTLDVAAFGSVLDARGVPFTGPAEPPTTPTNGEIDEAEFDEEQTLTLSWDTTGDEDATIISLETPTETIIVGATPTGVTTFPDLTLPPDVTGPVNIIIQTSIGPPGNLSPPLIIPLVIPFSIIEIEGDLTIDVALAGTMQVVGDPSGIYVSVPGKTNDTLYERAAGSTTSQDVAIPRPFAKVTYVP